MSYTRSITPPPFNYETGMFVRSLTPPRKIRYNIRAVSQPRFNPRPRALTPPQQQQQDQQSLHLIIDSMGRLSGVSVTAETSVRNPDFIQSPPPN